MTGRIFAALRTLPASGQIGLALVILWLLIAALGPVIAPHSPGAFVDESVFSGMSRELWLGTDYLGRDVLSRLLWGARYTVFLALGAAMLAVVTGTSLALVAAIRGGWIDEVLSRSMDTLTSIPSKIFALVLVAAFGSSLVLLLVIMAVIYLPGNFRIARALAVNLISLDFVQVARARGEGTAYIAWREILPNMIHPLMADMDCASFSWCCCFRASASSGLACSRRWPTSVRWYERIFPACPKGLRRSSCRPSPSRR